jgi:hypothetical protein
MAGRMETPNSRARCRAGQQGRSSSHLIRAHYPVGSARVGGHAARRRARSLLRLSGRGTQAMAPAALFAGPDRVRAFPPLARATHQPVASSTDGCWLQWLVSPRGPSVPLTRSPWPRRAFSTSPVELFLRVCTGRPAGSPGVFRCGIVVSAMRNESGNRARMTGTGRVWTRLYNLVRHGRT